MEPATLAAAAVGFLTPYLVKMGEKSAEKVGEKLPDAVGKLWTAVLDRFKGRAAAEEAIEEVVSQPENRLKQSAFENQVLKALETDQSFLAEFEALLRAAGGIQVQVGDNINVSGSGAGSTGGGNAAGAGGTAFRDNYGTIINNNAETPQPPSSSGLRETYLQWLVNQVRDVPLTGVDPKSALEESRQDLDLAAVYTALLTQQTDDALERGIGPDRRSHRLSALALVNARQHLALLGEPGSGKSTFVNYLALCLAGAQLGLTEANMATLTRPLPGERRRIASDQEEPEPQPWDRGELLPVRVVLRDFVARGLPSGGSGERVNGDTLWRFIADELPQNLQDFAQPLMAELRDEGGLLLLDGLDEVPEAQQRRAQVKAAVEDFAGAFPRVVVVVTSRTYAYQRQDWKLRGFAEGVLAPFDPPQVSGFVERWYAFVGPARHLTPEDARGRAAALNRAIDNNPRLRELATRPLLLTLMASLHAWRGGNLPEQREELYADAVELLLDQWESHKLRPQADGRPEVTEPSLSEWLQTDQKSIRGLLNRLAYQAHRDQPDLVGTADLPQDTLVSGLMGLSQSRHMRPGQLIEYLSNRAGLLVPRGVGVYAFSHRTFQEYLAACHLTEQDDFPDNIADLARADPNRWREVTLLAGAKAVRGASANAWLLAEALCSGAAPDAREEDPSGYWGALLAGQVLAENRMLAQVSPRNQPKLECIRGWLTCCLTQEALSPVDRALAGTALAGVGDPRFRPDAWRLPDEPLLGFVEIPAGSFRMGSDKEQDPRAFDDELPQHPVDLPGYYIGRYPVTVGQFEAFLEDSKYQLRNNPGRRQATNHQMLDVIYSDALAYCGWLTEKLREWEETPEPLATLMRREGWKIGLPSEAEWEKAARGDDGRIYPWGDEWDPSKTNSGYPVEWTSAVGSFPSGSSPYGCMDMAGNVWEWTRSLWGKDVLNPDFKYPYNPDDKVRENVEDSDGIMRVVRGGSSFDNSRYLRCACRHEAFPISTYIGGIGFRIAVLP